MSWATPTAGAAGSDTQIQYNSSNALAGSANLTWDNVNTRFGVGGTSATFTAYFQAPNGTTPVFKSLATGYGDGSNPSFIHEVGADGRGMQIKIGGSRDFPAFYITDNTPRDVFTVYSNGRIFSYGTYNTTTASAANVFVDTTGELKRSTSSLRYKRDVENSTHGLSEVLSLRPVLYKGTTLSDGDRVFGGLIAEEVHEAGLTEFVQYDDNNRPDSLAYGNMVSLCVKAIQELSSALDAANARIAALEAK
jgi:hypothetical protein